MTDAAIKGQETQLIATGPTGPVTFEVESFNFTAMLEIIQRDVLGETTQRKDSISNGYSGSMTLFLPNAGVFDFVQGVEEKAARRAPASTVYNIVTNFAFPDGTRARVVFEDAEFGNVETTSGSRADYVTVSMDWESSTRVRIG